MPIAAKRAATALRMDCWRERGTKGQRGPSCAVGSGVGECPRDGGVGAGKLQEQLIADPLPCQLESRSRLGNQTKPVSVCLRAVADKKRPPWLMGQGANPLRPLNHPAFLIGSLSGHSITAWAQRVGPAGTSANASLRPHPFDLSPIRDQDIYTGDARPSYPLLTRIHGGPTNAPEVNGTPPQGAPPTGSGETAD